MNRATRGRWRGPRIKTAGRVGRLSCAVFLLAAAGCASDATDPAQLMGRSVVEAAGPETVELAGRALVEGRYADARALLDRVLLAEPDNPRARLLEAELSLSLGDMKAALQGFENIAGLSELEAAAMQGRGLSLILTGEREAAYASLRRAVALDDKLWRAWNGLGYYHDRRGAWDRAEESYARALAANPGSAVVYNNRGYSRLLQRRFEEAGEDLNRALAADPGFDVARENLRLVFAWRGLYDKALLGVPGNKRAKALNNIGFVALLRNDFRTAEAFFVRAMEVDPAYNAVASRNLGYLKELRALRPSGLPGAGE